MIVGSFFNDHAVLFALICAGVAVAYGIALTVWLLRQPEGNERMREIAQAVQEGAAAYLKRQYLTIAAVSVGLNFDGSVLAVGISGTATTALLNRATDPPTDIASSAASAQNGPVSPSADHATMSASDAATRISPVKRLRAARSVMRLRGW